MVAGEAEKYDLTDQNGNREGFVAARNVHVNVGQGIS